MPSDQFALVLTTFPADGDAEKFAHALIDERLAACVNILPAMRSVYRWQGAIEQSDERQLLIKTMAANVEAIRRRVIALHPYDLPEFLVIDIAGGSPDYLSWLIAEAPPVKP